MNINDYIIEGDIKRCHLTLNRIKYLTRGIISKRTYNKIINSIIDDYNSKKLHNGFENYIKNNIKYSYTYNILGVGGYGIVIQLNNFMCAKIVITGKEEFYEFDAPKKIRDDDKSMRDIVVYNYFLVKNCTFNGLYNYLNIYMAFIIITSLYCENKKKLDLKTYISDKIQRADFETEYRSIQNYEKAKKLIDYLCYKYLEDITFIDFFHHAELIYKIFNKNGKNGYIMGMELAKCISVKTKLNPITKCIDMVNGIDAIHVDVNYYRILFLQLMLFYLKILEMDENFKHNDLKADNVLVYEEQEEYIIIYEGHIFRFNVRYRFKISDFDFSHLPKYRENTKISELPLKDTTWICDLHYFFHRLLSFIPISAIENDKDFFLTMFNIFVTSYCNTTVYDDNNNNKSKNCINARLKTTKKENIQLLKDLVLKSGFFDEWREKYSY